MTVQGKRLNGRHFPRAAGTVVLKSVEKALRSRLLSYDFWMSDGCRLAENFNLDTFQRFLRVRRRWVDCEYINAIIGW